VLRLARRIPLRVRVTLAFVATTAVVLLSFGVFLHTRLANELDESLHAALRQRAADLSAVAASDSAAQLGRSGLVERGDDLAQVLDADQVVVAGAPGFDQAPLLTAGELRRAQRAPIQLERPAPDDDGRVALLAAPSGDRVVVVGTALEERDAALASLDALLLAGIPVALALSALAGFLVAGAALRPMERLRARAETLGGGDLDERLPVPEARDEVRRLAETLNGMLERQQLAFTRERGFVADASHELRTPLARLKAELELATHGRRSRDELAAVVDSAAEETDALILLAEDLLVLARADQGRLPLRREPLVVGALLDRVRDRYAPHAQVASPAGLTVDADPVRLEQALGNLVDNARRHGGGVVQLSAEAEAGPAVALHVVDDGDGVPSELLPHAFERFTRGDAARTDGGTGLGLAIVAAIADAHGGTAGINARHAGGADVWISIPGAD